jgi:hypothetical protein
MLSEDIKGLEVLRTMEIVGVGGAALPPSVGDLLVSEGINLVSRFGSAECGFLLSSLRDYHTDKAWSYLRLPKASQSLRFEAQDDGTGLYELIVLKHWPHMAKRNREDGSYATSDLFEKHETIDGAWRYHSRSDSQLTLVTGKKFDPAPLEAAITSSSPFIAEALVFGSGRQIPGCLIWRSELGQMLSNSDFVERIWGVVESINMEGQEHTRIAKQMIRVLAADAEELEKSSKGTILRGAAEERFAGVIEELYSGSSNTDDPDVSDANETILDLVRTTVQTALGGRELNGDSDFYHHGVDSAKCTQIRAVLQKV